MLLLATSALEMNFPSGKVVKNGELAVPVMVSRFRSQRTLAYKERESYVRLPETRKPFVQASVKSLENSKFGATLN